MEEMMLVLLMGFVILSMIGCIKASKEGEKEDLGPQKSEDKANAEQTKENSPEKKSEYGLGDVIDVEGHYEVTFTKAYQTQNIDGNPAITLQVRFKNRTEEDVDFLTTIVTKASVNGQDVNPAVVLDDRFTEDSSFDEIAPGASTDDLYRSFQYPGKGPLTLIISELMSLEQYKVVIHEFEE